MSRFLLALSLLCASIFVPSLSLARPPSAEGDDFTVLSKKIDEQNAKIDALSQQILKLEQLIEKGKSASVPATTGIAAPEENATVAPAVLAGGNTHVVTRGETLTSIARQYKVGIEELQKFNHIEDARKLQLGQTIAIPGPSISPTPTP